MKTENLNRLRRWLGVNGYSQTRIAELLGVSQANVNQMLNGKNFGESSAEKWGELFGLNPKWLRFDAEPMFTDGRDENADGKMNDVLRESVKDVGIPVIPEEVIMKQGVDLNLWMAENIDSVEKLRISHIFPQSDCLYRVISDGMRPQVEKGDILALKRIPDKTKVIDGECYMIDSFAHGFLIRKIHYKDGNYRCECNIPEYGDMDISSDDVFNIYAIVGLMRPRVSSYSESYRLVQANDMKDRQINEMLRQNGMMIEQQDKLIDMIKHSD